MSIAAVYGLGMVHANPKELLFGIECEIESVRSYTEVTDWEAKADGSLRNSGIEFISKPLGMHDAVNAFDRLHRQLVHHNEDERFSPRTSIHVHVNCKNLEPAQVKNIVLMYALFEEFFFFMVEPSRRDNIHCVALGETHLPHRYGQSLESLHASWSKYTALNLKPLGTFGTLEFRHSHGHADVALFSRWLIALSNLFKLGQNTDITVETLTSENLNKWFTYIFGHLSEYTNLLKELPHFTENSLIDVKLSLI